MQSKVAALSASGMKQTDIAKKLGISQSTVCRLLKRARSVNTSQPVELTPAERLALLKVLGEMSAGPGFYERWSPLDVQTIAYALRRVSGVDLIG